MISSQMKASCLLASCLLLLLCANQACSKDGTGNDNWWGPGFIPKLRPMQLGSGLNVAPGEALPAESLGTYDYFHGSGIGYFTPCASTPAFPAYVGNGPQSSKNSEFATLGRWHGYWRAASGYYYPWCPAVYSPGTARPLTPPVYNVVDGQLAPVTPDLKTVYSDLREYLGDQVGRRNLSKAEYTSLMAKLDAIEQQSASAAEKATRNQLDLLFARVARTVKP